MADYVIAIEDGIEPTVIVLTTLFVAVSITETVPFSPDVRG